VGVLVLTGAGNVGGWRVPLLLLSGFATMFLGDILWSLAKVRGYYLPGGFQDVLYLTCYAPVARWRAQMRILWCRRVQCRTPQTLWRVRSPMRRCSQRFWYGVFRPRDIGGPTTVMTMIVFALTLLFMVRQGVVCAGMPCCASAGGSHGRGTIRIADSECLRRHYDRRATAFCGFVSPACERTLGAKPEEITGKSLPAYGSARIAKK